MKKIVLILGILAIVFTGCSKNTLVDNKKQLVEKKEETNSVLNISEATPFYDGIAAIEDTTGKGFVIDKNGNVLSELPDNIRTIGKDHNYEVVFFDDVASVSDKLINSNGDTIASPEKNGYTGLFTPFVDGYAIAYDLEENYPSSVIKLGVLNGKGEWTIPLSENNKLLKFFYEEVCDEDIEETIEIFKHSSNDIEIDGSKDLIKIETIAYNELQDRDYTICVYDDKNQITVIDDDGLALTNYDMANDKITEAGEGLSNSTVNGTRYHTYDFYDDGSASNGQETFKILKNDSGKLYCSVYDQNDKELMKPTDLDDTLDEACKCIYVGDDGFVIKRGDEAPSYTFYGLDGEKKTEFKDEDGSSWKSMTPFYEGLAFVKNYDEEGKFIDKSGKVVIE